MVVWVYLENSLNDKFEAPVSCALNSVCHPSHHRSSSSDNLEGASGHQALSSFSSLSHPFLLSGFSSIISHLPLTTCFSAADRLLSGRRMWCMKSKIRGIFQHVFCKCELATSCRWNVKPTVWDTEHLPHPILTVNPAIPIYVRGIKASIDQCLRLCIHNQDMLYLRQV
jgi:hypothetical protein